MLYDVEEIARLTKISKVTIYKKMKLVEVKPYVERKQGKSYVNDTGFNLIKESLDLNNPIDINEISCDRRLESEESELHRDKVVKGLIKVKDDLINTLNEQVIFLKQQIKEKDLQTKEKDTQINELHTIVQNSQVLLKEKPQQEVLQLEEHFQELDSKLMDIKQDMQERKETPKGIFKRIFKK